MTSTRLAAPNLVEAAAPAALDPSEEAVRAELHARLVALASTAHGAAAARTLGLEALLRRAAETCRIADLAVAVHRVENLTGDERVDLPAIHLVDDEDAGRHPGFGDVEQEALDEEVALLAMRAGLQ